MELKRQHITKLDRKESEFERQRFEYYSFERASRLDTRAREAWELYHNDRDGTSTPSAEHLPPTQDIRLRPRMQQLASQQATTNAEGPVTPRSRHSSGQTGRAAVYLSSSRNDSPLHRRRRNCCSEPEVFNVPHR